MKIGDVVVHKDWPEDYIGIIVRINSDVSSDVVGVKFWCCKTTKERTIGDCYGIGNYYGGKIIPATFMSKQDLVQRKIKLLWNKSNYVKNNPKAVMV